MTTMQRNLKLLIAEDSITDAELLLMELRRAGFNPQWMRVDSEGDYLDRLVGDLDLIISDYQMPQFNGLRALELLKASGLAIPFIIISGTIGEDTAVSAIKLGAADYLLKDRLTRLGPAISRALEENRLRLDRQHSLKTLRDSEEKLRRISDGISALVGLFSIDGRVLELNQAALRAMSLERAQIVGRDFKEGLLPALTPEAGNQVAMALAQSAGGDPVQVELLLRDPSGEVLAVEATFNPLRDSAGNITGIVVSGIDITKRRQAERRSREQLDELLRWQEVMLNREDRIQAMKAEVNELLAQRNMPKRYAGS